MAKPNVRHTEISKEKKKKSTEARRKNRELKQWHHEQKGQRKNQLVTGKQKARKGGRGTLLSLPRFVVTKEYSKNRKRRELKKVQI